MLDQEHQDKTKRITDEGRDYLQNEFDSLDLEYVPSYANFVLVKVGDGNAVFKAMMAKGIIVRAMAAYKVSVTATAFTPHAILTRLPDDAFRCSASEMMEALSPFGLCPMPQASPH